MDKSAFLPAVALAFALAACASDDTPSPVANACALVEEHGKLAVMLEGGPGKTALGTIDFDAHGVHDSVQLMINDEPMADPFDIIADPCTVDRNGNAVFNLHPPVAADPSQVDMKDGDKWTFSPMPTVKGEVYAVTDTTGASFANPVTPGWSGHASLPPPEPEGVDRLLK